jgi:hypothetical protein
MLAEFLTEIPMSRALPRIAVQGTKRNFSKSFCCAAEAIQMRKDRVLTPAARPAGEPLPALRTPQC